MKIEFRETSVGGMDKLLSGEALWAHLKGVEVKGLVVGDGVYNGYVHDPGNPSNATAIVGPRKLEEGALPDEGYTVPDTERDFGAEASMLRTAYELGRTVDLHASLNEAENRLEIVSVSSDSLD